MNRPPATISVDVDPVDLHLVGYGFPGLAPDPLAYTAALPRLLERFAAHGVRATLFIVARDAGAHADVLRAARAAGHEIACHSMTHPLGIASLEPEGRRRELAESKAVLERTLGADIAGFRAPNFDMDEPTLGELATLGYRYDASSYPSPLLLPARLVLALKSRDKLGVLKLKPWPFDWRRTPHRRAGGRLVEFPATVTPGTRIPIYHTLRYGLGDARFAAAIDGLARGAHPLSYLMHAVDALGLAEDRVDPRLAPHPGMNRPLAAKLALLDRTLAAIAARYDCVTFAERVARREVA